jgi:hypothetical protein
MANRVQHLWNMRDTELRINKLDAGCKTIEEAIKMYEHIPKRRVSISYKNRSMGRVIRICDPELFNTLHQRWAEEHSRNGNVMSKIYEV